MKQKEIFFNWKMMRIFARRSSDNSYLMRPARLGTGLVFLPWAKTKSDQKPFGTDGCTNIIIWHRKTLCKIKFWFTLQNQKQKQFYHALTSVVAVLTTSKSHINRESRWSCLPGNVKEQNNSAKNTVCFSPGQTATKDGHAERKEGVFRGFDFCFPCRGVIDASCCSCVY